MKNKIYLYVLLSIGIFPFLAPIIGFLYEMMNNSSWNLVDWLILYSFVYWPTYIIGFIIIIFSIYKLKK